MAKVSFGAAVNDARNKLGPITPFGENYRGGVVFSRGRSGPVIRAHIGVDPAYVYTDRQIHVGDTMHACQLRWINNLTDTQRRAWEQFAKRYPTSRPVNGTRPLSGYHAFLRNNLVLRGYFYGWNDIPPVYTPAELLLSAELTSNYMHTTVFDNFNRADAPTLGPNWTPGPSSVFHILNNTAIPYLHSNYSRAAWNKQTWTANHRAKGTFAAVGAYPNVLGVTVRHTAATITMYGAHAYDSGVYLYKWLAGTPTLLGSHAGAWAPGHTIELNVTGTELNVLHNGVLVIGPITDSDIATGRPGIIGYSDTTLSRLDDWTATDYTPSPMLEVTVDPVPTGDDITAIWTTPPLSAGRLNYKRWLAYTTCIMPGYTMPYSIYDDWLCKWAAFDPPRNQMAAGKRIGILAQNIRYPGCYLSPALIDSSITT